jgi:valyl-tRNA synthetase
MESNRRFLELHQQDLEHVAFVLMNLEDTKADAQPDPSTFDLSDQWIFARLNETIESVTAKFDKFEFGEAERDLYNFIWNELADWYIEMAKEVLYGEDEEAKAAKRINLRYVLDQVLRLLHPIMPFVTEKIWLTMPHIGESIVVAAYPATKNSKMIMTSHWLPLNMK